MLNWFQHLMDEEHTPRSLLKRGLFCPSDVRHFRISFPNSDLGMYFSFKTLFCINSQIIIPLGVFLNHGRFICLF